MRHTRALVLGLVIALLAGVLASPAPAFAAPKFNVVVTGTDAVAGKSSTFHIGVKNTGGATANNVEIEVTLPAGLTYATDTLTTCTEASNVVTCTVAMLVPNQLVTFDLVAAIGDDYVAATATGFGNATVSVVVTSDEVGPPGATGSDTIIVGESADLRIQKLAALCTDATGACASFDDENLIPLPGNQVLAGQMFVYTIWVDNWGPSTARNVAIVDTLVNSATVQILSCAFSVSQGGGMITQFTCTTGNVVSTQFGTDVGTFRTNKLRATQFLGPPDDVTVGRIRASFRLIAKTDLDVTNTVRTFADTPDPLDGNNSTDVTVTAIAVADLEVTKSNDATGPLVPGDLVTYTIEVTNNGPSNAVDVELRDVLPAGMELVSATTDESDLCLPGTPGVQSDPTICYLGTIPGPTEAMPPVVSSETVTIVARVLPSAPPGGTLSNLAIASSDTLDTNEQDNGASSSVDIDAEADLRMAMATDQSSYIAGFQLVQLTVQVRNDGPTASANTVASILLPKKLAFRKGPSGCALDLFGNPNVVECDLGTVAAGETVQITLWLKAKSLALGIASKSMWIDGSVASDTPDPVAQITPAIKVTLVRFGP